MWSSIVSFFASFFAFVLFEDNPVGLPKAKKKLQTYLCANGGGKGFLFSFINRTTLKSRNLGGRFHAILSKTNCGYPRKTPLRLYPQAKVDI